MYCGVKHALGIVVSPSTNCRERLLAMLYPDRDRLLANIRAIFLAQKTVPKTALVNELGDSTGESHPKIDRLNVVT